MPEPRLPVILSQRSVHGPLSTPPALAEARVWIAEAVVYADPPLEVTMNGAPATLTQGEFPVEWTARAPFDVFRAPQVHVVASAHGASVTVDVAASIVISQEIPVGDGGRHPLRDFYLALLQAMDGAPAPRVTVFWRGGSPPVPLPILLIAEADASMADEVAEVIRQWAADEHPPREEAQLLLQFETPALRLDDLTIEIGAITDL